MEEPFAPLVNVIVALHVDHAARLMSYLHVIARHIEVDFEVLRAEAQAWFDANGQSISRELVTTTTGAFRRAGVAMPDIR